MQGTTSANFHVSAKIPEQLIKSVSSGSVAGRLAFRIREDTLSAPGALFNRRALTILLSKRSKVKLPMIAAFAHFFINHAVLVKGSKAKLFGQGLSLFSNSFTHRGVEIIVLVCLGHSVFRCGGVLNILFAKTAVDDFPD